MRDLFFFEKKKTSLLDEVWLKYQSYTSSSIWKFILIFSLFAGLDKVTNMVN